MLFRKKTQEERVEGYTKKLEALKDKRGALEERKAYESEIEEEQEAIRELKGKTELDRVKEFGGKVRSGAGKAVKFMAKEGMTAGKTLSQVAGIGGTGKAKARYPSPLSVGFSHSNKSPSYFDSSFSPKLEQPSYFEGGLFGSPVEKPKPKPKAKPKKKYKKKYYRRRR